MTEYKIAHSTLILDKVYLAKRKNNTIYVAFDVGWMHLDDISDALWDSWEDVNEHYLNKINDYAKNEYIRDQLFRDILKGQKT